METLSPTASAKLDLSRFQKEKAWTMAQAFPFFRNRAEREALAPLLLFGCFLRLLFCLWLGLGFGFLGFLGLWLGLLFGRRFFVRLSRGLGGRSRRRRRHYGLFGDEDLFLFALHDLITATQLVLLLQP